MAINPQIKALANLVRSAVYGKDVRESIANIAEITSETTEETRVKQKTLETQFEAVIEGTTDKDVISAPEIIAARGTHSNLSQRLVSQDQQLAETEDGVKMMGAQQKKYQAKRGKLLFTIITDDGSIKDYTIFKDMFHAKGVKACTAAIHQKITEDVNFCNISHFRELQDDYGWEIVNHTKDHLHLGTLEFEGIEEQIKFNHEFLNRNGLKTNTIAYPYGSFNESVKRVSRKYNNASRSSVIGYNEFPLATHELRSIWLGSDIIGGVNNGIPVNTFEHYKKVIDDMVANGSGWMILSFHSWAFTSANDPYGIVLGQVIDYAKTKCEVVTMSEGLEIAGNVIEVGDTVLEPEYGAKDFLTVSFNGKVISNRLRTRHYALDAIDGSWKMASFDNLQTSINLVSSTVAIATGLPERSGTLTTVMNYKGNAVSNPFNYQFYAPTNSYDVYKRNGLQSGDWSAWNKIGGRIDSVPLDSLPSVYRSGISLTTVSASENSILFGYSIGGGMLKTFKTTDANLGYVHQEFQLFESDRVLKRSAKKTGTTTGIWGEWYEDKLSRLGELNTLTKEISEYPLGVTYTKVQKQQGADGLAPKGGAGVLVTYKFDNQDHSWNWQEYNTYGEASKFKRSFYAVGTPKSWTPILSV